jgi:hypothetical protein
MKTNRELLEALQCFESFRLLGEAGEFIHELVHGYVGSSRPPQDFSKRVKELRVRHPAWLKAVEFTPIEHKPAGKPLLTLRLPGKLTEQSGIQQRVRGCIGMRIHGTLEGQPVSAGVIVCLDCGPDPDTGEQDCFAMWSSWD